MADSRIFNRCAIPIAATFATSILSGCRHWLRDAQPIKGDLANLAGVYQNRAAGGDSDMLWALLANEESHASFSWPKDRVELRFEDCGRMTAMLLRENRVVAQSTYTFRHWGDRLILPTRTEWIANFPVWGWTKHGRQLALDSRGRLHVLVTRSTSGFVLLFAWGVGDSGQAIFERADK